MTCPRSQERLAGGFINHLFTAMFQVESPKSPSSPLPSPHLLPAPCLPHHTHPTDPAGLLGSVSWNQ